MKSGRLSRISKHGSRPTLCVLSVLALAVPAASAYQEAPILSGQVAAGELPPVEKRLPENPMVVEPVESIGKYGGTWRRFSMGGTDVMLNTRFGYEPIVRWGRSGTGIEPNVAESWEILDDGKTYVFHLRKGMKWSDGHPFTSEDYLYCIEDWYGNKELSPVFPAWLVVDGVPVEFSAPDPYTIVFKFARPYSIFLEMLAFRSTLMPVPKHYVKQFHAKYADVEKLTEMAEERGFNKWYELYALKADPNRNPDMPTFRPFKLKVPPPASRMVAERNPYYWKVDPEGNQLPYLDEIAYLDVQNAQVATMKAMAGETDFQARRIDATNYALFMENRERGGYQVRRDLHSGTVLLYLNQCSKDPVMRKILKDRRFRVALSVAINREELIFLMYSGMAKAARGVASPYDPYYLPEFDEKYLEYDPERANVLLDEVGLPRGPDGMRRMPDGTRFRQILNVFPSEAGTSVDVWQLVADYFREVGLDFVVKVDAGTLSRMQVCNGNSDFWAYSTGGMHWVTDPVWYVPWRSSSYFCPLYGRYTASGGKDGNAVKPPPEFQQLVDWYRELCSVSGPNAEERKLELGRKILRQFADECYTIGICRQELLTIVGNHFKNVPEQIIHDYRLMCPGYIGIEQFYIDQEVLEAEKH